MCDGYPNEPNAVWEQSFGKKRIKSCNNCFWKEIHGRASTNEWCYMFRIEDAPKDLFCMQYKDEETFMPEEDE